MIHIENSCGDALQGWSRITFLAALAGVLAVSCSAATAQSSNGVAEKVQLYLFPSLVAYKKGYVEKRDPPLAGGKVAFRECITGTPHEVEKTKLTEIAGDCKGSGGPWGTTAFYGEIIAVKPDGSVQVLMDNRAKIELPADAWQKAFKMPFPNYPGFAPTPKLGEIIGGIDRDNPKNVYVIEMTRARN